MTRPTRGDVYPPSLNVRGLDTWPADRTPDDERVDGRFRATLAKTLVRLTHELEALDAFDVWLEVAIPGDPKTNPDEWRRDGRPRAQAAARHPGVAVAFRSRQLDDGAKVRRYATDRHASWEENLRAIALGLEALRQVERYGIASRGQQHAGFAELPITTGGSSAERGEALVAEHFDGSVKRALRAMHPDTRPEDSRWTDGDYGDVLAFRQAS